jgi:uncharacterized SAM-binding protein YcdF (DUF218 family)
MARGIALFLGAFTLLNLAGDLRFAGAGGNVWWIDFAPLPLPAARALLALIAAALLCFALAPRPPRAITLAAVTLVLIAAVSNAVVYYLLLARGAIRSRVPIPLSLLIAAAMLLIAFRLDVAESARSIAVAFVASAIVFPLAQIATFGITDYRRPADLIVVFGAKAYADGTPSDALADRVRTACALYRAGLAPRLLFSGGPGAGSVDEPESMRRLATTLGVPDAAILRDPHGVNTESTARNTVALLRTPTRILAVSHFYHLPRIKMTYQRYGSEVFTVPCADSVPATMPFNVAREVAAFWRYYLRRV